MEYKDKIIMEMEILMTLEILLLILEKVMEFGNQVMDGLM